MKLRNILTLLSLKSEAISDTQIHYFQHQSLFFSDQVSTSKKLIAPFLQLSDLLQIKSCAKYNP